MTDKKIFLKRGAPNYHERKLLRQLEPAIARLAQDNPNFYDSFQSAQNLDELKALHMKYCVEDAQIITELQKNDMETKTNSAQPETFAGQDTPTEDPLNRSNPIVRDYVMNDTFSPEGTDRPPVGGRPNLDEPTNFKDAFSFPDMEEEKKGKKEKGTDNISGGDGGNRGNTGTSQTPRNTNAVNPDFDELSRARKNKQTKRFAKSIVQVVCGMLELGYVWWLTKDINESKLVEYQMEDSIDLSLLVTLDGEQEMTIREFFKRTCNQAQQDSRIDKEDQEELADALADVLMEKGLAPTPMQTLGMTTLKIVGFQFVKALMTKAPVDIILKKGFAHRKATKQNTEEGHAEDVTGKNNGHDEPEEEETEDSAVGATASSSQSESNEITVTA